MIMTREMPLKGIPEVEHASCRFFMADLMFSVSSQDHREPFPVFHTKIKILPE